MKLLKIKHYVEKSLHDVPSFVLLMSDNQECISIGCEFIRNNETEIDYIIQMHNCEEHLKELFNSPSIEMKDVTNTRCMFMGSNITEFDEDMSNVVFADYMFYKSKLTRFSANMDNVMHAVHMFFDSDLIYFDSKTNPAINDYQIFEDTPYLKNKMCKC
jgi:hypothetical protein